MPIEEISRDLRHSVRAWRKRPGFNALIVLTLALGIGANVTVFSVIETVLLRPALYEDPDRLIVIRTELPESGTNIARSSGPEILDLRERMKSIPTLGGVWARPAALTDEETEPEEIEMGFVTAGFLSVFGVDLLLGRDILLEEDVPNAPPVVVLSHGLWQRRYGGDSGIVGETISMDGTPHTVVGVLPASFRLLMPPDAGVPPDLQAFVSWGGGYDELARSFRVFTVVGRLAPDVSLVAAQTELRAITAQLLSDYPGDYQASGLSLHAEGLHRAATETVRTPLTVIWVTVGLVLIIAGANVLSLLLVRASGLEQEIVVKRALGAGRGGLMRPFVVDSILLSLCGGALGWFLARWGVSLLKWLAPGELPRLDEVGVDAFALGFVILVSLALGVAIGLVAALQSTRAGMSLVPRRSMGDPRQHRLRRVLVVSEVSLTLVLLVGAGLLFRSFRALSEVSLGYQTEDVSTLKLSLIDSAYPYDNPLKIARFYRDLLIRIADIPGVDAVGATTALPLDGTSTRLAPYSYESDRGLVEWDTVVADYRTVTPGWLESLRVPLLEGRLFGWTDDLEHPNVVVVDETLARTAWPGQAAVGKRVQAVVFLNGKSTPTWCEVVGVVAHVKHLPGTVGSEQIFLPHQQSPQRTMALAVRSQLPLSALSSAIRDEVRTLETTQPVHSVRPMDDYRSDSLATHRFTLVLLGAFSTASLLLAALGVYGVMAFTVSQRTREIGLRMALGAEPRRVRREVLGEGLRLVTPGVVVGFLAAVLLSPALSSLLFEVGAHDPATFAGVVLFLAFIAALACYVPGRRASGLDPVVALRDE